VPESRLVSTKAAAKYLACDPSTIRRLHYSGRLPAIRSFKYLRFDIRDLDAFIAASKTGVSNA